MLKISVQSAKLQKTLKKVWEATNANALGLVKQAMIFACQSMAKLTKPGTGSSYKRLAKKYTTRPIMRRPDGKIWYAKPTKNGRNFIWLSDTRPKKMLKHGIVRIATALKYWATWKDSWDYMIWWPGVTPEKKRNIPHAGAAKGAWLGSLKFMGEPSDGEVTWVTYKELNSGAVKGVTVGNRVSYARKIQQGGGVAQALKNAEARMRHTYFPKFKKKVVEAAHAV